MLNFCARRPTTSFLARTAAQNLLVAVELKVNKLTVLIWVENANKSYQGHFLTNFYHARTFFFCNKGYCYIKALKNAYAKTTVV